MLTNLFTILIVIAIVGVVVWFVQTYTPMPGWAKGLITAVCIIFALLWLLGVVTGHSALTWR